MFKDCYKNRKVLVTGHTVGVVWGCRPPRVREVMEPQSSLPVLLERQPCISLKGGLATLETESEEDTGGNR